MTRRTATATAALVALTTAMLAACTNPFDAGALTTEDRDVSGANAVVLDGVGRVAIAAGQDPSLQVTAGERLMRRITTTVDANGVLVLDISGGLTLGLEDVRYDLVLPEVVAVSVNGAGRVDGSLAPTDNVTVDLGGAGAVDLADVDAQLVEVTVSGAGPVTLAGRTDRENVVISGVGSYDGTELSATSAEVLVSGAGRAEVLVTGDLLANVSGAGSITYSGGATVTTDISGVGSVRERE